MGHTGFRTRMASSHASIPLRCDLVGDVECPGLSVLEGDVAGLADVEAEDERLARSALVEGELEQRSPIAVGPSQHARVDPADRPLEACAADRPARLGGLSEAPGLPYRV